MKRITKQMLSFAVATACIVPLGACGSNSTSSNGVTELTLWSWDQTVEAMTKQFNTSQKKIHVKYVNPASDAVKQYVALNNAIQAGKGAPDITLAEYMVLPQYSHMNAFVDLKGKGADKYKDLFTPGTWNSVNFNNQIYGMPIDSGPMALFYNKEVFDKAGIPEPPKTWDEFYQDAKKIRATGSYITADSGDGAFYNSMVWQAGGHPYKVNGDKVSIDLTDDTGSQRFIKLWQKLIDEDLIDTNSTMWTDEWNRALGDGSIASLPNGAWMALKFAQGAPQASGKWRVATMPKWGYSGESNSEWGGSSLALLKTCPKEKQDAAWQFIKYAATDSKAIQTRVDGGSFPATKKILQSEKFLSATNLNGSDGKPMQYFGGQEYNRVFEQAAKDVTSKWTFLPFEIYSRKTFGDSVGDAYRKKIPLTKGIAAWQDVLVKYAKEQGFTVK
ncbi:MULTISPECIES: sugar ABC transporter substrate-binding protein [unclassified Bifidobacterium]|uniref:ABC transporter substrate-binding protein n=1 Tax=unclassified Bifidobacterium TaxID=2608897 RepID=UPI0023F9C325|nr:MULTISPECIES: sugar ABC transporter substrate-binding protein [unclassified Bifidobacterium]WEV65304.1 sugar ABC transporter substrate-binding protein [Bifidobacterium sp. ESL0764]WEV75891.1 sugar ABC transporter substrate-binding protein [Bifidobacterium sp. ESL0800]